MRLARILLSLVVFAFVVLATSLTPRAAALDVYATPGTHHVNGRDWRTTCLPYSMTTRCRTEIYATQITQIDGRFVPRSGWYFNNLTYLSSPRSMWAGNPLGTTGSWTATDGREWTTQCDTRVTGKNGCRSYIAAPVIESYKESGAWRYRWTKRATFNNMVRFDALPFGAVDPATIEDPALRTCLTETVGVSETATLTTDQLAGVTSLHCQNRGIETLRGMPTLPNVVDLHLNGNLLDTLGGIPELPGLEAADLGHNRLSSVKDLPALPHLMSLRLDHNSLSTLSGMRAFPTLKYLYLDHNELTDLSGFPALTQLYELTIADNELRSLSGVPALTSVRVMSISDNRVRKVALLSGFTGLETLTSRGNPVADWNTLGHLVAAGLRIYN